MSNEVDNTVEKLYHLWTLSGNGYERITAYPMSHSQCLTMKGKHNRRSQAGILLCEVGQTPPNSNHDYAWLDEMGQRMLARGTDPVANVAATIGSREIAKPLVRESA